MVRESKWVKKCCNYLELVVEDDVDRLITDSLRH